MENAKRVDSEILEYIKEIASKMKNNRAAVMVGAGFSKNAEAITQTDKQFLDWNALGDYEGSGTVANKKHNDK